MMLFESIELENWNGQSLIVNDCILTDLGFANISNCPMNEAAIMRTESLAFYVFQRGCLSLEHIKRLTY